MGSLRGVEGFFMAGRKALVLSVDDVNVLIQHVRKLPFKRKVDERFLVMVQGKRTMADFSVADLDIVKKCRYEMNAHLKQMAALSRIKVQSSWSGFERDIVDLSRRTDIDGYFLMLDALKMYLKKADQKQAEAKLKNDKKRMEHKLDDSKVIARKQRDRENYFLGASLRKLLDSTGVARNQKNDLLKLGYVVNAARLVSYLGENQVIDLKEYNEILVNGEDGRAFLKVLQDPG